MQSLVITHRKEQPLKLRAIPLYVAAPSVLRELVRLIVLGGEVEEDGGGLEDVEAVGVGDGGDAAVGVFLLIVINIFHGVREKGGGERDKEAGRGWKSEEEEGGAKRKKGGR